MKDPDSKTNNTSKSTADNPNPTTHVDPSIKPTEEKTMEALDVGTNQTKAVKEDSVPVSDETAVSQVPTEITTSYTNVAEEQGGDDSKKSAAAASGVMPQPGTSGQQPITVKQEKISVVSASPKDESPMIVLVKDGADITVTATKSEEETSVSSLPEGRPNAEDTDKSNDQDTTVTAPPKLENNSEDQDDDEDLDEFIKSPHGQNAIIERSPGGRYVRFMEKLGSGASKDVYRAYDTQEGIEVAWNVVSLAGVPKTERNRIVNEVRLLERLHHHNIISFHGSWVNRERQEVHFVTEILSSGTLKSFIKKVQVIRWKIAKRWAVQILKGLDYLHSQVPPVIHRDLKCENIFINGTSGDLRIGDLGLSTVHRNGRVLSVLGTPEFMAPDMYEDTSYDTKVDIYAFGMCMLEIFTKEIPYKECRNPAQIYKKVSGGELPETLHRIRSRHARDFIMLCLGYKDENGVYVRPTAKELLSHEFLVKRSNDEEEVLVDPPLIKKIIAEEVSVSPGNSVWPTNAQSRSQSFPSETSGDKQRTAAMKKKSSSDLGSADGDESDQFEEMPDSEVNIRKVKVLMGRGKELKEDEEPFDSGARSTDGSMHSRTSQTDRPSGATAGQGTRNGVNQSHNQPKYDKTIKIGPSIQVTQPGQYLVAAAVVDNEAAQAYPDDILKLVITLPVEGQTQNVQFDFHLVEDDAIQVGKEMVAELGIPQGAILEISETISGLACAARMQRDQYKLRAQQNAQQQQQGASSQPPQQQNAPHQQHSSGGSQDFQQLPPQQQGVPIQLQQQQLQQQQQQQLQQQPRHDYQGIQAMVSQQPADQVQRRQSLQQQHQQQQIPQSSGQSSQMPPDMHSQTSSYAQPMQNQNQISQHSQVQSQAPAGNHMMSDSQPQPAHYGYESQQCASQQNVIMQNQPMGQHTKHVPLDSQSLPAYGYDTQMNQAPLQNTSYGYDPNHQQNQGQHQVQAQHMMMQQQQQQQQQQQNQGTGFRYDGQQHQQVQGNPSMVQQGNIQIQQPTQQQQPNQMPPQQIVPPQNHRGQQQPHQPMQPMHQNYQQQHGGNQVPLNQQQLQPAPQNHNQLGMQGYSQGLGQGNQQQPQQPESQVPSSHSNMLHQSQQQQAQPQPQQQIGHPPSPNQQQHKTSPYEHGISLPNARSQLMGTSADALKRSTSTNSYKASGQSAQVNGRGPPSRNNSGHATRERQISGLSQQMTDEYSSGHAMSERQSSGLSQQMTEEYSLSSQQLHDVRQMATGSALIQDAAGILSEAGEEDGFSSEELRKLDEDFQKNLMRAKKVFDNRMDNLQRSQIEREAQHQKTLERHQKEKAEFEKRLQQEAREQSKRIEQLQREWDRKRMTLAQQRRISEDSDSESASMSLSSSPDTTNASMPRRVSGDQTMPDHDNQQPQQQSSVQPSMSNDSGSERVIN